MKRQLILLLSATFIVVVALICCGIYNFRGAYNKIIISHEVKSLFFASNDDRDGDGIKNQEDILQSVRQYIATNPQYKSNYYTTGYPNDGYGVCTDVVAFGLRGAGFDLMTLVHEDIEKNAYRYNLSHSDINIDFRRVSVLKVFFAHNATSLTTDITQTSEWQGGDIVVYSGHVGIVSDKRNDKGVPYIIHHANPRQTSYEEDILGRWKGLEAHYRMA